MEMQSEYKRACDCCNIRKIRCPGGNPCAKCIASGIVCTFLRERKKSGPRNLRQSRAKILRQQSAAFTSESLPSLPASQAPISILSPSILSPLSLSGNFALDEQQPLFTGTILPAPAWDFHRISLPVLQAVLLLYKEKLYGLWPLIQVEDLLFRLETEPNDAELYALATALCAASLSYLNCSITHEHIPGPIVGDTFVTESRRVRSTFNYMEPVGLNTVLTSYFLHMHYGRQPPRTQMAAFYIREAITFAHLLGMHNECTYTYPPWTTREQAVMRRLYFLLFMTERYLCIEQGLPTVLESISLPDVLEGEEQYPDVVSGFVNLVTLFSTPGSSFFSKWTSHASDMSISREQLQLIQRALQRPLTNGNTAQSAHSHCHHSHHDGLKNPCPDNPIQLVDIVVSQHWFRSLAWRLSVLLGYIVPSAASPGAMSVNYPLEIATDTLRGIQMFPNHAFEVHGPGMEAKMCEVTTGLADSILYHPTNSTTVTKHYCNNDAAKAVLKGLADRIFEMQPMNQGVRDALAGKIELVLKCSNIAPSMPVVPEEEQPQDDGGHYMF